MGNNNEKYNPERTFEGVLTKLPPGAVCAHCGILIDGNDGYESVNADIPEVKNVNYGDGEITKFYKRGHIALALEESREEAKKQVRKKQNIEYFRPDELLTDYPIEIGKFDELKAEEETESEEDESQWKKAA